jgi:hypothetical protein
MTIEQVAAKLECSVSKVSRIETGQVGVTPRDVRDMADLYHVNGGHKEALMQLSRDARKQGWWAGLGVGVKRLEPLIGLETEAAAISEFQLQVVPGLLQTPDYARAVFNEFAPDLPAELVEQHVGLRLARQRKLAEPPTPQLDFILDEAVLLRTVGGDRVMRGQLEHLIKCAAFPNVSIQVLPFSKGAHGMLGGFTILRFTDELNLDVVHLENEVTDLYVEGEDTVRYLAAFGRLRLLALDSPTSAGFIADLL